LEGIQFVSVHIRRTEYVSHVQKVYPNATAVGPEFYANAFQWLKKQVNSALMFVVITDDMKWAQENVANNTKDVFTPGKNTFLYMVYNFSRLSFMYNSIRKNTQRVAR